MRFPFRLLFLLLGLGSPVFSQTVLRGQVRLDLEMVFSENTDVPVPYLDNESARRRALEQAALFFQAMIYGWSFDYEIGERARGIAEHMELTPQGEIRWGDPRLFVTGAQVKDTRFFLWADYQPSEDQQRRLNFWRNGTTRPAQAVGSGPLGGPGDAEALEDAARAAVRAMLRGSERNRPKEARGFIALAEFPVFWMDGGRWTTQARFLVRVAEIIPFAAY